MNIKLQPSNDSFVQFTEDQMQELNIKQGDKFSITVNDNGSILLAPYKTLEVELGELSREVLESLIQISCEKDISCNEVVSDILRFMIEQHSEEILEEKD